MRIYERKNILERNINYSNAYGRNLLQEAIVSCENAIAVDLVNKGIDIDHQDKMGWTPLHFCAQYNNNNHCRIVITRGSKGKYYGNDIQVVPVNYREEARRNLLSPFFAVLLIKILLKKWMEYCVIQRSLVT